MVGCVVFCGPSFCRPRPASMSKFNFKVGHKKPAAAIIPSAKDGLKYPGKPSLSNKAPIKVVDYKIYVSVPSRTYRILKNGGRVDKCVPWCAWVRAGSREEYFVWSSVIKHCYVLEMKETPEAAAHRSTGLLSNE